MIIDDLYWVIGLNIVFSIWLGMLADAWKGRQMSTWVAIGLCTSVAGLVMLLMLPKLSKQHRQPRDLHANLRSRRTDSYSH